MNEERLASLKDRLERMLNISIIYNVCKKHGVTEEEMHSLSRKREIVDARNIAQYHQHIELNWSPSEIADYWGMKRTGIDYALKKVKDLGLTNTIEL